MAVYKSRQDNRCYCRVNMELLSKAHEFELLFPNQRQFLKCL